MSASKNFVFNNSSYQSVKFDNDGNSDMNHHLPSTSSHFISLNSDQDYVNLNPPRKNSLSSELSELFSNLQTENHSRSVSSNLLLGTHSSDSVSHSIVISPISSPQDINFSKKTSYKETNSPNQDEKDVSLIQSNSFDQEPNLNARNKKRSRVTTEQLSILESNFRSNPIPNGTFRRDIATKCGMTERSVQIWFQNRRARERIIQRKMIHNYHDSVFFGSRSVENLQSQHPSPSYYASNHFEKQQYKIILHSSQQGFVKTTPGIVANDLAQMQVRNVKFSVSLLAIGRWSRMASVGRSDDFLNCTANFLERCFIWMIVEGSVGFRMRIPFFSISKILLCALPDSGTAKGEAQLILDLNCLPTFMMEIDPMPQMSNWIQCEDFTEDSQGSIEFKHILHGKFAAFQTELVACVRSEPLLSQIILVQSLGQLPQKLYQQSSVTGIANPFDSPIRDFNTDNQQCADFPAANSTNQSLDINSNFLYNQHLQ
ncbi:hypothetical protein HK096_009382, partial [Nowakowskiella sp. JEL0078]